jgi:hypothetical protein
MGACFREMLAMQADALLQCRIAGARRIRVVAASRFRERLTSITREVCLQRSGFPAPSRRVLCIHSREVICDGFSGIPVNDWVSLPYKASEILQSNHQRKSSIHGDGGEKAPWTFRLPLHLQAIGFHCVDSLMSDIVKCLDTIFDSFRKLLPFDIPG